MKTTRRTFMQAVGGAGAVMSTPSLEGQVVSSDLSGVHRALRTAAFQPHPLEKLAEERGLRVCVLDQDDWSKRLLAGSPGLAPPKPIWAASTARLQRYFPAHRSDPEVAKLIASASRYFYGATTAFSRR